MSYNIIEESEWSRQVKVTMSEIFGSGLGYVQMKVEIEGDQPYFVDFDNPAQVESCMWQMQEYLKRRNTFGQVGDSLAAEGDEPQYGVRHPDD